MFINEKPDIFREDVKPYFTRKEYGGYSPGIKGNIECFEGCSLNNCTSGAWGLFAMAENNPNCKVGFIRNPNYYGDARSWFNDGKKSSWDNYERGYEAKKGSIICYDGNTYGHVAYVLSIDGDELTLLSSGYGNSTKEGFDIRKVRKSENYDWPTMKGFQFQGFIYPKYAEPTPERPTTEITSAEAIDKMAEDVILGKYGNGVARIRRLYETIQGRVNEILARRRNDKK